METSQIHSLVFLKPTIDKGVKEIDKSKCLTVESQNDTTGEIRNNNNVRKVLQDLTLNVDQKERFQPAAAHPD